MTVFISGGCKNGKSSYAERVAVALSKNARPLYYVATMCPSDEEDYVRIDKHRRKRSGLSFHTVEISHDILFLTDICDVNGTFLLDSTTALLASEMFPADGTVHLGAGIKIADEICQLDRTLENIVIVSDYIFSDANLYEDYTEHYKKSLAHIGTVCADISSVVVEACYGTMIFYRGADRLVEIFGNGV